MSNPTAPSALAVTPEQAAREIKPCLFCGKEQDADSFYYNGSGPPPSYSVGCGYCGARGPCELGRFRDDHEGARRAAVQVWNEAHAAAERRGAAEEREEVKRLRAAIVKHRSQKADDRCIEDDDELYTALGDGIKCDRRVGDKDAMLANCARFIERRCEGGGWPSYTDLEAELEAQRHATAEAERKGFQLCNAVGMMMLALKRLQSLQKEHRNCICDACLIPAPDLSPAAIDRMVEASNTGFAVISAAIKWQEARAAAEAEWSHDRERWAALDAECGFTSDDLEKAVVVYLEVVERAAQATKGGDG